MGEVWRAAVAGWIPEMRISSKRIGTYRDVRYAEEAVWSAVGAVWSAAEAVWIPYIRI